MNKVEISIVIPTYNRKENLKATLALITQQSLIGVEIIISDNASEYDLTDLKEQYKKNPHIIFFRNKFNVGLFANLFRVIELARGSYVWTLGDDDLPSVTAIADIRAAIRAIGSDVPVVAIKFSSHLLQHDNEAINSLEHLYRYITDPNFFSSLLFLSSLVLQREKYMYFIRHGYNNTLTNYAHLIPIFAAMDMGASVYTSNYNIIKGNQKNSGSWAPGVIYMTMLFGSRLVQGNEKINISDAIQLVITRRNKSLYLAALILRIHFTMKGENRKNYLRLYRHISLKSRTIWFLYIIFSPILTAKNFPTLVSRLNLGDITRV